MNIEWNRVTWYSKVLAILVFGATFFVGFKLGSLYQQAKDYSALPPITLQLTPTSNTAASTSRTSENGTANTAPPTATHYNGMLTCKNGSGCPAGYSCMRPGPIMAGQQPPMVCVPSGQAVPL